MLGSGSFRNMSAFLDGKSFNNERLWISETKGKVFMDKVGFGRFSMQVRFQEKRMIDFQEKKHRISFQCVHLLFLRRGISRGSAVWRTCSG